MKHSESVKIYQASRYHGNVKAVYSMYYMIFFFFLTESVANDNVNNDVIVLLLFSSRQFYLTHWGTWYNYARTLPGGGGYSDIFIYT